MEEGKHNLSGNEKHYASLLGTRMSIHVCAYIHMQVHTCVLCMYAFITHMRQRQRDTDLSCHFSKLYSGIDSLVILVFMYLGFSCHGKCISQLHIHKEEKYTA